MTACLYGCSRDHLIGDLVTFQLALKDGSDELLACIRIMRDAGVGRTITDMLLRTHLHLCWPEAWDSNSLFDLIGPQPFSHRAVDPVVWLAKDNARRKVVAA